MERVPFGPPPVSFHYEPVECMGNIMVKIRWGEQNELLPNCLTVVQEVFENKYLTRSASFNNICKGNSVKQLFESDHPTTV